MAQLAPLNVPTATQARDGSDNLTAVATINAGGGDDIVWGGAGRDIIDGGSGADRIDGAGGEDFIEGGRGDDFLVGGRFNDVIAGGDNNDILHGGGESDSLYGGAGNDVLMGDLTTVSTPPTFGRRLLGWRRWPRRSEWRWRPNVIFGGAGNDEIDSRLGVDLVYGGDGDDY